MIDVSDSKATEVLPSIWGQIEQRSRLKPDSQAIFSPNRSPVTYGQLWARMEAVTRRLGDAGVGSGATVAVVLPEGPHFLSTLLAVSRLSACAPINPALTATEMETYLTDLAPDALLVAPECTVAAEVGRRLGLTVMEAKEEMEGWRVVSEGRRAGRRYDAAVILQTSATTGKGKLVGLSRENLNASAASSRRALALTERDRVLLLSPLFHLQGIISAMAQLAVGGSAVATSGFDREKFTWWLQRLRPTWYTCGPTMHRAICSLLEGNASVPEDGGSALGSLRFVRSIGAPLSAELAQRVMTVLGVPVLNGYGMTETGVVTSMPTELAATRTDSVGKTTGTEIRIVNAEGCDVSPGEEGEIILRGANVMAGYLNDVEGNRRSYWDGWFRTGDLGRLDAEAFLYITGRLKEQINRAGEKIHPSEVDDVVAAASCGTGSRDLRGGACVAWRRCCLRSRSAAIFCCDRRGAAAIRGRAACFLQGAAPDVLCRKDTAGQYR